MRLEEKYAAGGRGPPNPRLLGQPKPLPGEWSRGAGARTCCRASPWPGVVWWAWLRPASQAQDRTRLEIARARLSLARSGAIVRPGVIDQVAALEAEVADLEWAAGALPLDLVAGSAPSPAAPG